VRTQKRVLSGNADNHRESDGWGGLSCVRRGVFFQKYLTPVENGGEDFLGIHFVETHRQRVRGLRKGLSAFPTGVPGR